MAFPAAKTFTVQGARVNIRSGPGTTYSVITVVSAGQRLKGLGKQGDWYQVELPDGRIGWIFSSLVTE